MTNDWIPHHGGKCPVDEDVIVNVICREGIGMRTAIAAMLNWKHNDVEKDIIAYRIVTPHAEQPETPRKLMLSAGEMAALVSSACHAHYPLNKGAEYALAVIAEIEANPELMERVR